MHIRFQVLSESNDVEERLNGPKERVVSSLEKYPQPKRTQLEKPKSLGIYLIFNFLDQQ
jgi:hypothetical protein